MRVYDNEIVIPLEVVRTQSNQIIDFARESKLEVNKVGIEGLDMVVYSNSNENVVAYFKYLMNNHIKNINKLERISNRK